METVHSSKEDNDTDEASHIRYWSRSGQLKLLSSDCAAHVTCPHCSAIAGWKRHLSHSKIQDSGAAIFRWEMTTLMHEGCTLPCPAFTSHLGMANLRESRTSSSCHEPTSDFSNDEDQEMVMGVHWLRNETGPCRLLGSHVTIH